MKLSFNFKMHDCLIGSLEVSYEHKDIFCSLYLVYLLFEHVFTYGFEEEQLLFAFLP